MRTWGKRKPDLAERALAAAWPVSPPVYPAECAEIGAEVATLLQTNLRNPHTVRDSSVLMYNEFARDGTLQPLHRDSAEGRPLETVEVEMEGRGAKGRFATAEDYAPGVAAALISAHPTGYMGGETGHAAARARSARLGFPEGCVASASYGQFS